MKYDVTATGLVKIKRSEIKKGTDKALMNLFIRFLRSSFLGNKGLTAATQRYLRAELRVRELVA